MYLSQNEFDTSRPNDCSYQTITHIPTYSITMSSSPSVPDTPAVAENFDSKNLTFGRTVVPVMNRNKAPKKGQIGELFLLRQSDQAK